MNSTPPTPRFDLRDAEMHLHQEVQERAYIGLTTFRSEDFAQFVANFGPDYRLHAKLAAFRAAIDAAVDAACDLLGSLEQRGQDAALLDSLDPDLG